jgi:hypothetical protein
MDDDRVQIGQAIDIICLMYGWEAAEELANNLHGLSWNMRITHGDVERYLPRKYYLKWMGFDVVNILQ